MRNMHVKLILLASLAALPLLMAADQFGPMDSPYLAISAKSPEGVDSVRIVTFLDGQHHIGVWEDKPFLISVSNSYPAKPSSILLAMSDGNIYPVDGYQMEYSCEFLMPYYGMVIVEYPDEHLETKCFFINGAWREKTYPTENEPPLTKPAYSSSTQVNELIERWWEAVEQAEKDRIAISKSPS